jgi:hypothetical protein
VDTPSGITRVPGLSALRWHRISRALFLAGVTLVAAGVLVVVVGFATDGAAVRIVGILIALAGVTLIFASWSPVFPYFRRVGEELEAGYTTMERGFEWVPRIDDRTGVEIRPGASGAPDRRQEGAD